MKYRRALVSFFPGVIYLIVSDIGWVWFIYVVLIPTEVNIEMLSMWGVAVPGTSLVVTTPSQRCWAGLCLPLLALCSSQQLSLKSIQSTPAKESCCLPATSQNCSYQRVASCYCSFHEWVWNWTDSGGFSPTEPLLLAKSILLFLQSNCPALIEILGCSLLISGKCSVGDVW